MLSEPAVRSGVELACQRPCPAKTVRCRPGDPVVASVRVAARAGAPVTRNASVAIREEQLATTEPHRVARSRARNLELRRHPQIPARDDERMGLAGSSLLDGRCNA